MGPELHAHTTLDGRYELGPVIGTGAGSEVRRAFDRRLRRNVAVKCLDLSSASWARFQTEARLAALVSHPAIVTVFDVGRTGRVAYIVMECLPGTTLADEIRRGPMTDARVSAVTATLLDALGAAHAREVLHRDIKPTNVLLDGAGNVKLSDFGIATGLEPHGLTETGVVLGTPMYLAPERLRGEPASPRSDLYAVGVIMYEMLTARPPFRGDSPMAIAYAANHGDVEPVRSALRPVVGRAMSRDPRARYESAREMALAVRAAGEVTQPVDVAPAGPPTRTMVIRAPAEPKNRTARRGWIVAVVLLAMLGALAAGIAGRSSGSSTPPSTAPGAPGTTLPLPPALTGPFERLQHAVQP